MDELTTGNSRSLDRPVHRACVVAGCWCRGAARPAERSGSARRARGAARTPDPASVAMDLTAWRTVGLPVA